MNTTIIWSVKADSLAPLRWKRAMKVRIVEDLFSVETAEADRVQAFAVMALTYEMRWTEKCGNIARPRHTFLVETQNIGAMAEYIAHQKDSDFVRDWFDIPIVKKAVDISRTRGDLLPGNASIPVVQWLSGGCPALVAAREWRT